MLVLSKHQNRDPHMSRKTTAATVSQSDRLGTKSKVPVERFEVDAFDHFIEEQLKKQRSSNDNSSDEIVCHVY